MTIRLSSHLFAEESKAAKKAKQMGLEYMGFGRWGKNGKVTHKTPDGQTLTPLGFKDRVKDVGISAAKGWNKVMHTIANPLVGGKLGKEPEPTTPTTGDVEKQFKQRQINTKPKPPYDDYDPAFGDWDQDYEDKLAQYLGDIGPEPEDDLNPYEFEPDDMEDLNLRGYGTKKENTRVKLSTIRQLIREHLEEALLEFEAKHMPNGTAWKVSGKGWAAKNKNGVTNYWYGPDDTKNKEFAEKFRNDTTKKPTAK